MYNRLEESTSRHHAPAAHLSDAAQRARSRKVHVYDRRRFHHLLNDVQDFHALLQIKDKYHEDSAGAIAQRVTLLKEEAQEFEDAVIAGNLPDAADALIDSIYVAVGTLALLDLPAEELWTEVHAANMRKKAATLQSLGKRGSIHDAVKPEGWRAPDVATIVNNHLGKEVVDAWLGSN